MYESSQSVRDKLSAFSNGAGLRQPMVKAISAVQDFQPHVQILSLAIALEVLCDGIGKDAHEVVSMINRAKADTDAPFAGQYQAMRNYSQGEFK